MTDKPVVDKALAYILNGERLLVFRHLDHPYEHTGLQVPGGTIRPGETPAQAALREAREETGLTALVLVGKLGRAYYDISPLVRRSSAATSFHLIARDPVPERWESAELHDGLQQPTRLECFWLPLRYAHALAASQGALIARLSKINKPPGRQYDA